jgi:PAS domain S-box-containing protein
MLAGIVALVAMIAIWNQAPTDISQFEWRLAVWVALYTAARLLNIAGASNYLNFTHIVLLGAYFSFRGSNLQLALLIALLGIVLEQFARVIFGWRRTHSWPHILAAMASTGAALATTLFGLSVASFVFTALGGNPQLSEPGPLDFALIAVLFIVYTVVVTAIDLLLRSEVRNVSVSLWLRRHLGRIAFYELSPLVLSLVIAAYADLNFTLFVLLAVFLLVLMVLLRRVNNANAKLEERAKEIASVSAVGQAIVNSLDLPELLEATHQHISPLMDARNFYVALYHEEYNELAFPLAYEDGRPVRYRNRNISNGLTEHVLRTREPLLIPSDLPRHIERLGLDVVAESQAQCWLGVPITIGDKVLGVMAVQSNKESNLYDNNDVELLSTIATQMAVAIENAQLYASTRRRAAELAILNSVSTAVGSSLKLDQVMEAIVTSVGPVIGCQKVAIFLVEEDGQTLSLAAARGLGHAFLKQSPDIMRVVRGEGSAPIADRPPLIINDIRLDARFEEFRPIAEREAIRALADVPLQTRDQAIGTLSVYYSEPHLFTVAELDLLTTFANQAAAAVSNAKLYAQTDQALTHRVQELAALEKIGRELTSSLDFNHVIARVLDAAIQSTHSTHGLIALYNGEKHTLDLVAAHGYPPDVLAEVSIENWPARQHIVDTIIRERKAIWIEDIQQDANFQPLGDNILAVLVVPILQDGQPLGVINLESIRRGAFDESSATFVGQLTTQAAVAIQNARLYQQARNRLREMQILFDVGRRFTSILDLPELGQTLTRQLATALNTTHCILELISRDTGEFEVITEYATPENVPVMQRLQSVVDAPPTLGVSNVRRSLEPIIAYADDTRPGREQDFLRAHQLYALLALPLISGDQLIGRILWLNDQLRPPFSPDEIRFGETLTNQASIAVENARLFRERARRASDLSRLQEASLALAASVKLDEVLNHITYIARELTGSEAVTIYLYDAATDRVTRGSQSAAPDFALPPDISTIRPDGMTRRVIAQRHPILINDIRNEPRVNPHVIEAGVRSLLALPIVRKTQVVAVLYLNSRTPGKYTQDTLQLVQLLTNQAAIALENARLFSEIAETRDRLAAILNSSELGVLMFDISGRVIVVNPVLEQLWNVRHSDLHDKLLIDLLKSPEFDLPARLGYTSEELHRLISRAASDVHVNWGKETITLTSPRARTVERTGMAVVDENGGLLGWMLVLRDVTEEHELQRMREDLSNMIVHDLRSPLVAILDSYELMSDAIEPLGHTAIAGQALEVGQRSSRKLLDLVNSLLDISRFENGQMPLDTQFASLQPIVEGTLERLAPLANDQGVIIRNEVPEDLPLLKVDEDKVGRVLINLIDNAVKFSPVGGQVRITAQPNYNGDGTPFVICSIQDAGPGIAPEYRERIFDRFTQVAEGRMHRRGTGLGLAFCKLAVEAHGGKIWVEDSPDGKGSCFNFTLPIGDLLPP